MALDIGARIGRYEVRAVIGAGGMGVVYRARDTRLNRDVAIKLLSDAFTASPERLARLEREAQVLAALNHANIAAIYEVEDTAGTLALILEFIDGPTLAERLVAGPIPLDDALSIARQIVDACEAAHEHGIVHRDLKPANIKLRPDGTVKVLDFGLAKIVEGTENKSGLSDALTPTIGSPALMTGAGIILGTAAYMSPEQARGRPIDRRADIWAFGCVLYEMLTRRRAFGGEEITDVLARILERDPDFGALPPRTPDAVRRLLRRCLEKNVSKRLRDIADARFDLDEARSASVSAAEAIPSRRLANVRAWPLALALIFAVMVATYILLSPQPNAVETRLAHVQMVLPKGIHVAVDTEHPALALSPDGSHLVCVGDENGQRRLYMRSFADPDTVAMAGTEGASSPFYSPDGAWIGFFAGNVLKKMSSAGGVPIAVHTVTATSVNRGAAWVIDDTVAYAGSPNSGLSMSSIAGERRRGIDEWTWITDNTAPYAWPNALPNGRDVLFTDYTDRQLAGARVAVVSVDSKQIRTLIAGTNPRYATTGHILFARSGGLYAVPYDAGLKETTGPERPLLQGVLSGATGAAQFAVARDGTLAYVAGETTPTQHEMVWVDRTGRVEPLLDDGRTYEDPRLSPDGARLAFTTSDGSNYDIWIRDLARGTNTRLTTHPGEDFEPVWSPDGRRLAFASEIGEDQQNPGPALAWIAGFDKSPEQLLRSPGFGNWEFPVSWSPDGRWLAFVSEKAGASRDIMLLLTAGAHQAMPFFETPANEAGATFSPDGRWIAYMSDETGREEVYVRPFPGPGAPITISTEGGVEPRWGRNGRELFYQIGNRLMGVTIKDAAAFVPSAPTMRFEGRFEMKGY